MSLNEYILKQTDDIKANNIKLYTYTKNDDKYQSKFLYTERHSGKNLSRKLGIIENCNPADYETNPNVVIKTFKKIQDKSNAGDFSGIEIGDYVYIGNYRYNNILTTNNWAIVCDIDCSYFQNGYRGVLFQFLDCPVKDYMNSSPIPNFYRTELYSKLNASVTELENTIFGNSHSGYGLKSMSSKTPGTYQWKLSIPTETQIFGSQIFSSYQSGEINPMFKLYEKYPSARKKYYNGEICNWLIGSIFKNISGVNMSMEIDSNYNINTINMTSESGISPIFYI